MKEVGRQIGRGVGREVGRQVGRQVGREVGRGGGRPHSCEGRSQCGKRAGVRARVSVCVWARETVTVRARAREKFSTAYLGHAS